MKLLENMGLLVAILAVQAWCVGWAFGLLRLVQAMGLERDTLAGRSASITAAVGGVAVAVWTLNLAWKRWQRR